MMLILTGNKSHSDCVKVGRTSWLSLWYAMVLLLLVAGPVAGETYKWTDKDGNLCFSDDPTAIPKAYRKKVTTDEDITLANPDVRREVEAGRRLSAASEREQREWDNRMYRQEREAALRRQQEDRKAATEKKSAEAVAKTSPAQKKRRVT